MRGASRSSSGPLGRRQERDHGPGPHGDGTAQSRHGCPPAAWGRFPPSARRPGARESCPPPREPLRRRAHNLPGGQRAPSRRPRAETRVGTASPPGTALLPAPRVRGARVQPGRAASLPRAIPPRRRFGSRPPPGPRALRPLCSPQDWTWEVRAGPPAPGQAVPVVILLAVNAAVLAEAGELGLQVEFTFTALQAAHVPLFVHSQEVITVGDFSPAAGAQGSPVTADGRHGLLGENNFGPLARGRSLGAAALPRPYTAARLPAAAQGAPWGLRPVRPRGSPGADTARPGGRGKRSKKEPGRRPDETQDLFPYFFFSFMNLPIPGTRKDAPQQPGATIRIGKIADSSS